MASMAHAWLMHSSCVPTLQHCEVIKVEISNLLSLYLLPTCACHFPNHFPVSLVELLPDTKQHKQSNHSHLALHKLHEIPPSCINKLVVVFSLSHLTSQPCSTRSPTNISGPAACLVTPTFPWTQFWGIQHSAR